jgi:hypothetical protein
MSDVGGVRGINSLIVRQGAETARSRQPKSEQKQKPLETEESALSRDLRRVTGAADDSVRGMRSADTSGKGIITTHSTQHLRANVERNIASENLRAAAAPQPSALANSYGKAAAKGKIPPFRNASSGGLIIK